MIKSIKFLWEDFVEFIKFDFKPLPYIYALTVIALSIVFAYTTELGGEIVRGYEPFPNRYANSILMYSGLYFLVAVPMLVLQGKYKTVNKLHFYLKGFALTATIGFTDIFSWTHYLDLSDFDISERIYLSKFLWRSKSLLFELPVLLLLRFLVDKEVKGLYGICRGKHHIKAYLWLFLLVMPILIAVSFTPDFLSYYPIGKTWTYSSGILNDSGVFGCRVWTNLLAFELVYIASFLMVELVFRGALVIGMGTVIARSAVLPMVAVYVALHFGKPVLETISAIFGGFALGALAYQSKHIWGGVIIHMGIAFAIEVIRLLQYYLLGI